MSNNKAAHRQGKVQLIDASGRFAKLRKNLGAKNCELSPDHIREIMAAYRQFAPLERCADDDLAGQIFDNADFGYYKVTIERPQRLKAQFTPERIAPLRFDKSLQEPMQWAFETYGERVYTDLPALAKEILAWCEQNDLALNSKKRNMLTSPQTWQRQKELLDTATYLLNTIGPTEQNDFNRFKKEVEATLKAQNLKLSTGEKNAIYNAVTWYDDCAAKVINKRLTLRGDKLTALLDQLSCTVEQLPDYGYDPTAKKGEYVTYESATDLRDYENIPLKEDIYAYFVREVKPHVEEAWLDLDKTKIGYEISFNKYFYQHQPLRSLEDVTAEILALEEESEGLILEILGSNG